MKKINWRVRFLNPVFWWNFAAAMLLPTLTYLGIEWKDLTTWAKLWETLQKIAENPAILSATAISIWNLIQDPTTVGLCDSARALGYREPGGGGGEKE